MAAPLSSIDDQLLQRRQLPLEIEQAAGSDRILNKRGPAPRMAEHFGEHDIGKTGRDDHVGKSAGERRQVGGKPRQTIFADDRDRIARRKMPSAHKPEQHVTDHGAQTSRQEISSKHSPFCNLIKVRSPNSAARWKKIWPTWRPVAARSGVDS